VSLLEDPAIGRRSANQDPPDPVSPPSGRRDRRPLVLAASLALIGASVAGFVSVYASAGRTTPVVVLVHPMDQGQLFTSSDLGRAEVSVPTGVGTIPVSEASLLSGKRAATALPAGSLLTPGDLSSGPSITEGDAVVGLALKDGALPASGLSPGDPVLVVQTAAPGSALGSPTASGSSPVVGTSVTTSSGVEISGTASAGEGTLVPVATVFAVAQPDPSSSGGYALLVSIEVPSDDAAGVATAAAAGQVSLVLLPVGTTTGTGTSGAQP
jgi:hypothetical protein